MLLYDSRTRRKEPFRAEQEPVTLYVCGITPYDTTHLGHAFTYVFFDVLIRYLRYLGYQTRYVQNVTDVDDDIMRKSRELGVTWDQLADRETRRYQQDMAALNVLPPDVYPRASQEIQQILEIVQVLVDKGLAYQSGGNVYFQVAKDPSFGVLSGLPRSEMLPIANRRGNDPADQKKRDPLDFVLWQESAPGEPRWASPWGEGRPGWHIECSAMALHYLGDTLDIHGGGADLIFPHHESEIAQSVNFTGQQPFARHWIHTAMVHLDGEKMSKSLGNLVLVGDLLKDYSADAIRVLLLSHRHTEEWSYDDVLMAQAVDIARSLKAAAENASPAAISAEPIAEEVEWRAAMDDDLDTPRAILVLRSMASRVLSGKLTPEEMLPRQYAIKRLSAVLGLTL